jgi:hypothetical protein
MQLSHCHVSFLQKCSDTWRNSFALLVQVAMEGGAGKKSRDPGAGKPAHKFFYPWQLLDACEKIFVGPQLEAFRLFKIAARKPPAFLIHRPPVFAETLKWVNLYNAELPSDLSIHKGKVAVSISVADYNVFALTYLRWYNCDNISHFICKLVRGVLDASSSSLPTDPDRASERIPPFSSETSSQSREYLVNVLAQYCLSA